MGLFRRKKADIKKEIERLENANSYIIEKEVNDWFEKFHKRKADYIG